MPRFATAEKDNLCQTPQRSSSAPSCAKPSGQSPTTCAAKRDERDEARGVCLTEYVNKLEQFAIAASRKGKVLGGETALYAAHDMAWESLKCDCEQESRFGYREAAMRHVVNHIAEFTSGIWQVHPFCEGNARATASGKCLPQFSRRFLEKADRRVPQRSLRA